MMMNAKSSRGIARDQLLIPGRDWKLVVSTKSRLPRIESTPIPQYFVLG
jgi:hypothetical protein